jgi:hypothetical protein
MLQTFHNIIVNNTQHLFAITLANRMMLMCYTCIHGGSNYVAKLGNISMIFKRTIRIMDD